MVQQLAQIFRPALHVRGRIERVFDAEFGRRPRHELHEPLGAFGRDGRGIEAAFGLHHAGQEVRIDLVPQGGAGDPVVDRIFHRKQAAGGRPRSAGGGSAVKRWRD